MGGPCSGLVPRDAHAVRRARYSRSRSEPQAWTEARPVVDIDRHRLRGDAVVWSAAVVHLHRHRVALPRLVVERPTSSVSGPLPRVDGERVLVGPSRRVGQPVGGPSSWRSTGAADILTRPGVLGHAKAYDGPVGELRPGVGRNRCSRSLAGRPVGASTLVVRRPHLHLVLVPSSSR